MVFEETKESAKTSIKQTPIYLCDTHVSRSHTYIHTYIHTCMHACTHARTHARMHACMHA